MSSGLMLNTPKKGEVYRHQNGVKYRIEGIARVDNDYQELLVVATGPDGVMWARPIGNFMGLRGGKPRFEKVDEVMDHPGVTFQGSPKLVQFEPGSAQSVTDSLGVIKAENGSWELRKDGILAISEGLRSKAEPYAVIDGVTYLTQAALEKSWLNLDSLEVGKAMVGEVMVRSIPVARSITDPNGEYHWNRPEDLPPVSCDLLIKVPEGTKMVMDVSGSYSFTTEEKIFKVFRTSHLADRAGDMEYRLPDNSTVTGRFAWTYP